MQYRKLEPAELTHFADAWRAFDTWSAMVQYARDLYGPQVATLQVEVAYEYDDMNAYFPSIAAITARDTSGAVLEFDRSTAWWQTLLSDEAGDSDRQGNGGGVPVDGGAQLPSTAALDTMDWLDDARYDDAVEDRLSELPTPSEDTRYDVHTPPALPFPAVYVEDDPGARSVT